MISLGCLGKLVRSSMLFMLLAGTVLLAAAQHDRRTDSPRESRPAPAPRASAPQHAPVNRSAPAVRPPAPNNRQAPANRPNRNIETLGHTPNGTTMGNRSIPNNTRDRANNPNMDRPATTMGRNPGPGNGDRGVVPGTNYRPNWKPRGTENDRGAMGNSRAPMRNENAYGRSATRMHSPSRPLPGRQLTLRGGGSAVIRPNGQIRTITRNGLQINRGMNGSRTVVSTRGGARIVTTGRHSGYVQRTYVTRGRTTYVSRTVVVNRVTYTRVYRSYSYRGYCCYYGYHPVYYYAPVYYGWAYNPWATPVYYTWGWHRSAWFGFYGGYFSPYPSYPSAAFWLTDYLIAANLQAAYEARAAARAEAANAEPSENEQQQYQSEGNDNSAANSGQVTLTPEVKEAIAEEVRAQLTAQQAEAQQSYSETAQSEGTNAPDEVPAALDPARHTFIVSSDLTVSADGQECQLTPGDVIKRTSDTPDENRNVTATVSASKKSSCAVGSEITISVDDLQEMHNKFEEQLDNGMKDLATKQGKDGLPKAPDTKTKPSDVAPPPPDKEAVTELEKQQAAADQTESQVVKEAFSQGS